MLIKWNRNEDKEKRIDETQIHHKFNEFLMLERSRSSKEDIYEVSLKLLIKKENKESEQAITSLLTDIRSITRVTIVSSLNSRAKKGDKILTIKVKFNVKKLGAEGYTGPQDFVDRVLVPTIQTLDSNPRILSISKVKDTVSRR